MSRRRSRERALQSLYQMDIGQVPLAEALEHVLAESSKPVDEPFLRKIVEGTYEHKTELDEIIDRYSVGWETERMPSVDRNVLRIAAFEFIYHPETPEGVVVNEAVELAKKYSTEESGKFVNGILGKMIQDIPELRVKPHDPRD